MEKTAQPSHKPFVTTVSADTDAVKCDGGNGNLGHPAVYYRFDGKKEVVCGYCGHVFVKAD